MYHIRGDSVALCAPVQWAEMEVRPHMHAPSWEEGGSKAQQNGLSVGLSSLLFRTFSKLNAPHTLELH